MCNLGEHCRFLTRPRTLEDAVLETLPTLQCEPTDRCEWSTRREYGSAYFKNARHRLLDLINLLHRFKPYTLVPTSTVKMGFSFKGLTTSALVNGAVPNQHANEKDIADVPAAVDGHTSMDASRRPDEKIGAPRSPSSMSGSDDEELNKVDTHAEQGVQAIQAVTFVWTKKDLIMAYVL